jgi:diguanylate cyclase (GGDEF)-like protein/PAS domain S-box-containing protein
MPFYGWPTYINVSIGVISFFLYLSVFIFTWKQRYVAGAKYLGWLTLLGVLWSVAYFLKVISWQQTAKEIFDNLQFLPVSLIPIVFFCFVALFSRWKGKIKLSLWILMLIHPVLTQIVIWTNPLTHWFRVSAQVVSTDPNFAGMLDNRYGWWFWLTMIYLLTFLLVCIVALLIIYFRSPSWARGKILYITIGVVLPLLAGIATFPESAEPIRGNLLLLSLGGSIIFILLGLFRIQVVDMMPIARKTILEQMPDAVIVLDEDGLITEFNNSAKRYFSELKSSFIGKPITELLPNFPPFTQSAENVTPEDVEINYQRKGEKFTFVARISAMKDENQQLAGWVIIFHNITRRKLEAEKLQQAEAQALLSFSNAQKHAEELALLHSITAELNQATSLRQALIPTMSSILKVARGKQIWILLLEEDNHSHRTIQYFPDDVQSPLVFHEIKANRVECLSDLLSGELTGPKEYPACSCREDVYGIETSAARHLSFPLRSGVGPLGVINLTLEKEQAMEEGTLRSIETICGALSVSVERVRLFRSEYDQRRTAETMQEISVTLTASLDLNEVLDLLLEQISRLVPYDAGNVLMVEENKIWMARCKGYEFMGKKSYDTLMQIVFNQEETPIFKRVITEKKVILVNDTHSDPEWVSTVVAPYFHSWLGAPIVINDRVVAIFSLDKREAGFYNQSHIESMSALCSNAALAIQNAKSYEAGIKRIRELESLQATLKDISSELDLKKLLYAITERAVNLLGATGGILGEYNKANNSMDIIIGINNGIDLIGESIPMKQETAEIMAGNGQPFVIRDYQNWEHRSEALQRAFPHSVMQVPLIIGKELLGAIAIGDIDPVRIFDQNDTRLISLFAQQAVIAISNARFYNDARKRAEEAETMRKAGAIVASSLEQKQALRLILEQLALVIPCDSASILLPKGDDLEIVDGRGFDSEKPVMGMHVPIRNDQPGSIVFNEKRSMVVRDMALEYPAFNNIYGIPIQSWIGVPLIFQKKAIGILAIDSMAKNSYTEEHARLAQAFADQVAIALENVRLYEEAVKSAKRLAGLYKMSQRINANLKPEEVYRAIHKATIELMDPDSFILSLYDEDAKIIHDVYFVDHGIPQKNIDRPLGEGFSGRILKEKKTIMYNNFNLNMLSRTKAVLVGDDKDPTMVRSLIIVPLKLGKKIKGIISAQSYRGDAFSEEDKETLELLAAHAVIALENSQLFSEIQELAITDPLTRIFNRRQFFELAEQEFERTRRYARPLSIIMFDIDLFKKVNDTYGHSVGDVVLQQVAEISKRALRDVDIFARYGGEEFVILLPETTAIEAQLMAERLRQLVARTTLEINKIKVNITLSFGVVEVDDTCRDTEDLLDRSDQALYHSKGTGRNRSSIWTPEMHLSNSSETTGSHRHT